MDTFTLSVVVGMVVVMVVLAGFVLIDKGAPAPVAGGKPPKRSS
jgi:hypothetical protein